MPDIFSWVMLVLGVGVGASTAFLILKNRGQDALHAKDTELAGLVAKETVLQLRQQELTQQATQLQGELSRKQSDLSALQGRMDEAQASFAAREKLLRESNERMKVEFESLATKVLNAQGAQQRQSLDVMLNPFREQIGDFRKRVEEVYRSDTKERASLLKEMQNLQSASDRINTEAENLTKALKGDNKIQGNWGELVLERILEDSGLRKDHEYFVQPTSRDELGRTKRPDIVIRLPEGKDVVVDSKVTLVAYEQALSSEDEQARQVFMKQHVDAVKSQVKKLAEQDYDQLPDLRSLDFVLLFIPIESAFTLAMELDSKLFVEAFNKRIMLVSPTTLMMALRIIDNLWQVEKQNRNAQDIAQRAGALYDKLQGVVEEVDKLGKQLGTVQGTYDTLYGRLASGRGNLVGQAEKLRELGAPVKKPIVPQLGVVGDSDDSA
ncbi:MAG: DNA recombination protein RmuC [Gammaproteobacteria bacterium TMED243]|nr:DNA recombination protein RmuC [Gammaproteobacteria bacterium]RPG33898.1 MAG: DNA recombination protein RmuC [Gammaproteobacteria bacterium TMED243]